ncbi:hypothetical protein EPN42_15000 [bacterium]|nr:MAG: hypothetical protein EPN42_15000 [bacterium]
MVALAPFAIAISAIAAAALLLYALWDVWGLRLSQRMHRLRDILNRAGVGASPEELLLSILGSAAILWIGIVLFVRPPFLVSVVLLAALPAASMAGLYAWVNLRYQRRLAAFVQQLELALRLIGSGLRVGLGLRQALTLSLEELPDPARYEFTRVVGQTNLGVSVYDALDDLAARMASNDMLMMARVIRIQSQVGGDLAKVLEHLAGTIRERRRMDRKKRAITAEGRASAIVLCAIPLAIAAFVVTTQVNMGHALIYTAVGRSALMAVAVLELLAIGSIRTILRNVA